MGPKVTLKVEQELLKFTEGCSVLTSLNERGNEHFLVWFGYHSGIWANLPTWSGPLIDFLVYVEEICPDWTHEYKQSRAEVELSTGTDFAEGKERSSGRPLFDQMCLFHVHCDIVIILE